MTGSRSAPVPVAVPPPSEAQTVILAQQGEADALDELARSCRQQAYVFALQLIGHPDDALDVAQDAMVRFFRSLGRFDPSRPVRPWLLRIVRNLVRDRARRLRIRRTESLEPGQRRRPAFRPSRRRSRSRGAGDPPRAAGPGLEMPARAPPQISRGPGAARLPGPVLCGHRDDPQDPERNGDVAPAPGPSPPASGGTEGPVRHRGGKG